jgi:hypothetical protein
MLASSGSDFISQYWGARWPDLAAGGVTIPVSVDQRKKAVVLKTTAF